MMNKFLDEKVPPAWEKAAYPSLKPLAAWVNDLIQRVQFISQWLYEGNPPSYWFSAFFFPQGFMTAALQSYARKTKTPIDALAFRTNVREYMKEGVTGPPDDGV